MSTAGLMLLTPRLRPRSTGPALRSAPLPVTATVLSALTHGLLAVIMIVAASTWSVRQPRTYVVNLVPAVAAVGTPQGRTGAHARDAPAARGAGATGLATHAAAARARDPEGRTDAAARAADPRAEPAGPQRQPAGSRLAGSCPGAPPLGRAARGRQGAAVGGQQHDTLPHAGAHHQHSYRASATRTAGSVPRAARPAPRRVPAP